MKTASLIRQMSTSHSGRYTSVTISQIGWLRLSPLFHCKRTTAVGPNEGNPAKWGRETVPQSTPGCHSRRYHSAEWQNFGNRSPDTPDTSFLFLSASRGLPIGKSPGTRCENHHGLLLRHTSPHLAMSLKFMAATTAVSQTAFLT